MAIEKPNSPRKQELSRLVDVLPDKKILGDLRTQISGFTYDSREVKPGDLFAAIRGSRQDGHLYVPEAVQKAAAAVLLETPREDISIPQIIVSDSRKALADLANAFYGYPGEKLTLVGVTGTNGKTTVTYLCDAIFREMGYRTGVIGTIQYKIGDTVLPCKNTTPESSDLFRLFHQMVENGVQAAAMEVSSHALEQGRIHGILFDVAVFTNLTQDHLDYHKTMEAYFEAKSRLFTKNFMKKNPVAVINCEDPYGKKLLAEIQAPALTYGISGGDVHAKDVRMDWNGISFTAVSKEGEIPVQLSLSGSFNLLNALAAVGVGLSRGFPLDRIRDGLAKAGPVRGRFDLVQREPFSVLIDYAHTPAGLENLLRSARTLAEKRLLVVFGCGGDRDRGKRPQMGRIAEELADVAMVTSDNPRSEEPMAIIREIESGMRKPHAVEADRKKAIEQALSLAESGDCVVIAGKGHETVQIFKDHTIHFDDREVVETFLGRKKITPV